MRVSRSGIEGAGWGLFALHTFKPNELISVYFGGKTKHAINDSVYGMKIKNWIVDPSIGNQGNKGVLNLNWGAHFANDYFWTSDTDATPSINTTRKHNNAIFRGLFLVATKYIKPGVEICVGYNFEKL